MYWCGDVNLIDFTLGYVPFFLLPPLVAVTVRRLHGYFQDRLAQLALSCSPDQYFGPGTAFMPGKPYANRFWARTCRNKLTLPPITRQARHILPACHGEVFAKIDILLI